MNFVLKSVRCIDFCFIFALEKELKRKLFEENYLRS